ncbi:MAG: hypothetical protein FJZ04_00245 [Candidatus Moranbacteria bacterium]|nr:hypothetical protein [Candidatus Moranbacteria bacterium]
MGYEKSNLNDGNEREKTESIIIENVPFVTQLYDTDNYQILGFKDLAEAEHWSKRDCGIVCIEMAVRFFLPDLKIRTKELINMGLQIHAYKENVGWIHDGLVEIATRLGLKASRESIGGDLEKIKNHLEENRLVIASISHGFEVGKEYKEENGSVYIVPRGGHLAVIFGITEKLGKIKSIYLHHPSPYKTYSWKNYSVSANKFMGSFSERGNIISLGK